MVGLNSLRNAGKFTGAALSVILLLLTLQRAGGASALTQTNEASSLRTPAQFAQFARTNFFEAQQRHRKASEDPTRGWEFARACFDLGDFATNNSERAEVAQQAITVCRALIAKNPRLLEARYYLAMNLGQLARTKSLGALKLVDEMEQEFLITRDLDEHFDNAGSDRNLGLLYRDAPSFGSIGSRSKAKRHLLRAAVLAPDYPENRLNLLESYLSWGDRTGARRELKALDQIWPFARAKLIGDAWAASWSDWQKRLRVARAKVEDQSKVLQSPRQQQE